MWPFFLFLVCCSLPAGARSCFRTRAETFDTAWAFFPFGFQTAINFPTPHRHTQTQAHTHGAHTVTSSCTHIQRAGGSWTHHPLVGPARMLSAQRPKTFWVPARHGRESLGHESVGKADDCRGEPSFQWEVGEVPPRFGGLSWPGSGSSSLLGSVSISAAGCYL